MAEITCCTGQTECNHLITIGYLKNFIGNNIKDSNGNTVTVNTTKTDSYVPTYSELTGGTLIPQFVDAGNNKWHSNVDGITINGTYSSNQGVEQNDLVLTYTKFKSLSISAGKTSFDECGDSTTISATYKLTKTVKAMNSCVAAESSSEGSDTTCKMSFSSNQTWLTLGSCSNNSVTASAGKNGTWSASSRSGVISASVTYKGQTHNATSITITQDELTGSYSVYEGRHYTATTITSHDELTQNSCSGITVNASATAYYYDRYKWKDSCGLVYEYNYDDRYGNESAGSASHKFDPVYCPTTSQTDSYKMTITYQGNSDSVTFYQVCSQQCAACEDYNTYGECTTTGSINDCGGDITVSCSMPTRIHHMAWNATGGCEQTGYTDTAYTQSAVVTIPENTTQSAKTHTGSITTSEGGTINYTITQAAGPCGGCGEAVTTYSFSDVSVNCSAHTNEQISVPYTSTTTYSVTACSSVTTVGTSSFTINIAECNETTSIKNFVYGGVLGNFTVHQAAGNGSCCCSCDDFSLESGNLAWTYSDTSSKSKTYTGASCISNITATTNNNWFTVTAVNGSITVTPSGQNSTTSPKEGTITVSFDANGSSCTSKTFTVTQAAYGCTCADLTIASTPGAWSWDDTSTKSASLTVNSECITNIVPTSDNNWFTTSLVGNNVNVTPSGNNTTLTAKTATITVSYSSNGTPCSDTFVVSQDGALCPSAECVCYVVGTATANTVPSSAIFATVTWPYSAITWTTGYSCDVSSAYTSSGEETKFVKFNEATCDNYTKSGSFTWSGHTACGINGCSSSDVSVSWLVNQEKPAGCDCTCADLTIASTPGAWSWDDTSTKSALLTVNSTCVTDIAPTSNNNWFSVSLVGNSVNVTPSGNNTTSAAKTATITVSYSSNGTPCSDTFEVSQGAAPCSQSTCVCYIVGAATASTVTSTATSATVKWPYSAITWTTGYSCDVSSAYTSSGESTQTVTFAAATCDNYTKNGTLTWANHKACGSNECSSSDVTVSWSVTQTRPAECDCSCGDLTVGSTSETWTAGDISSKNISITSGATCITGIQLSPASLTYFNASLGTNMVTVSPKSTNPTQTARVETLTISYNSNGSPCSSAITLTQNATACTSSECTCYFVGNATANTVTSTATSATVTWPYTAVTWTTASTCTVSSSSTIGTSSSTVTFAAATCDNYTKSGSFTWTGYKLCNSSSACTNTDATISWNVNQERPPICDCDCGSLTLSPTALTWAASSTAVTDINVTSASCVSGITLNTPSHFSATTVNGKIQVKPRSTNTDLTDIVQTLTVNYSYEGATATTDSSSVDLGLPSGLLWSKTNVGASSESDYGNYYQYGWGSDTYPATPHSMYSGTENPLAASADSATQVLGSEWHTPTASEFQELVNNTTYQWTTINGVRGTKFTAQNGNYIFFPAAGIWDTGALQAEGQYSFCWTSTPYNSSSAKMYMIGSGGASTGSTVRVDAISVRGVKATTAVTSCSSAITLTHQAAGCDCTNANMSYTFNGRGSSSSNRVPATGGTVVLTYSTNCGDGYILSSSDINGSSVSYNRSTSAITITVPSTLSTTGKTYTEYLSYANDGASCVSFTIYQSAPVEECSCSNANVTLTGYSNVEGSAQTQVALGRFSASCFNNLTVRANDTTNITNLTYSESGGYYYIYGDITENPSTSSTRSFTLTVSISGNSCATATTTQARSLCKCEEFAITSSTSVSLGSAQSSSGTVGFSGNGTNVTVTLTPTSASTWLGYNVNQSTRVLTVSAKTENQSIVDARSAVVTIRESGTDVGNCDRTITVTQKAKPSTTCPDCSIFTSDYDWGSGTDIHNY